MKERKTVTDGNWSETVKKPTKSEEESELRCEEECKGEEKLLAVWRAWQRTWVDLTSEVINYSPPEFLLWDINRLSYDFLFGQDIIDY